MTKKKAHGAGLTLEEAMKVATIATPEELRYSRSSKAGPDADRKYGAPPRRGRPKKGARVEPVVTKTVKHTPAFWKKLAKVAESRGLTPHEAMRAALTEWLEREAG